MPGTKPLAPPSQPFTDAAEPTVTEEQEDLGGMICHLDLCSGLYQMFFFFMDTKSETTVPQGNPFV